MTCKGLSATTAPCVIAGSTGVVLDTYFCRIVMPRCRVGLIYAAT